jgi:hypothetical protein
MVIQDRSVRRQHMSHIWVTCQHLSGVYHLLSRSSEAMFEHTTGRVAYAGEHYRVVRGITSIRLTGQRLSYQSLKGSLHADVLFVFRFLSVSEHTSIHRTSKILRNDVQLIHSLKNATIDVRLPRTSSERTPIRRVTCPASLGGGITDVTVVECGEFRLRAFTTWPDLFHSHPDCCVLV